MEEANGLDPFQWGFESLHLYLTKGLWCNRSHNCLKRRRNRFKSCRSHKGMLMIEHEDGNIDFSCPEEELHHLRKVVDRIDMKMMHPYMDGGGQFSSRSQAVVLDAVETYAVKRSTEEWRKEFDSTAPEFLWQGNNNGIKGKVIFLVTWNNELSNDGPDVGMVFAERAGAIEYVENFHYGNFQHVDDDDSHYEWEKESLDILEHTIN